MEGTYPLPEAQRDRFMARISMGYPSSGDELAMLSTRETASPLDALEPVVDLARAARDDRRQCTTCSPRSPSRSTRSSSCAPPATTAQLRLGASPRATLQLIRAAKAHAAMHGRDFVLPDDVDALAVPVLAHRLVPTSRAVGAHDRDGGPLIDAIVRRIVSETPVPVGQLRRD